MLANALRVALYNFAKDTGVFGRYQFDYCFSVHAKIVNAVNVAEVATLQFRKYAIFTADIIANFKHLASPTHLKPSIFGLNPNEELACRKFR